MTESAGSVILGLGGVVLACFLLMPLLNTEKGSKKDALSRVQIADRISKSAVAFFVGAIFIIAGLELNVPWLAMALMVGTLLAVTSSFACHNLRRLFDRYPKTSNVLEVTGCWISEKVASAGKALSSLHRRLAPNGWLKDFTLMPNLAKFDFGPSLFFKVYVIFMAVGIPVIMSFSFMQIYYGMPDGGRRVFSLVVGYNSFLVLSSLTVAAAFVVIAAAVLRYLEIIRFPLKYGDSFRTLASYVGYGTAFGLFAAAIAPVLSSLPIFGVGATDVDEGMSALTPSMLIELPAVGAVLGYAVGLLALSRNFLENASNVVYRRLVAPTLFIITVSLLPFMGLSASQVSTRIVGGDDVEPGIAECSGRIEDDLASMSDGQAMDLIQNCGSGDYIVDWLVITVGLVVLGLIMCLRSLYRDITKP